MDKWNFAVNILFHDNKIIFFVCDSVHHKSILYKEPARYNFGSIELISSSNFNAQFFINNMLLHYYPQHFSRINMPIFKRKDCIHTASGIFVLCNICTVHSQPVYCADVYRERRYQMLCLYNLSSWRWAC
jgi:hypothetical protein